MRKLLPFRSFPGRRAAFLAIFFASGLAASRQAAAAQIEAVRDKNYALTGKHGPWMIMVTSLWGTTPEQDQQADKAANELVYQLRRKGVPAYTYRQDDQYENIDSVDRQGRPRERKITSQHGMVAVLAGNYHNADDDKAQKTLKFIKKFKPVVAVDWQGRKQEVPLVLTKAFMTRNPMLSPEELAKKNRDPLIVKLNSGDHSLFENKAKYTLVVASFYGQSVIKPKSFGEFDRMLSNDTKNKAKVSLDNAARDSWELMTMLRNKGYDAYVYHERFRSIVTVGAFKAKDDPRIAKFVEQFRAKEKLNPQTKQMAFIAESMQVPSKRENDPPLKAWMFDPYPELMEVP